MTTAYVRSVGRAAYLWGWPLINNFNRAKAFAAAPEPGLLGGELPIGYGRNAMLTNYISLEQTFVTCTNQDVVYGAGFMDLDKEPIVFQVPDFKDRFWVYAHYDARTDEFSEIGKQYGTKPGFYLMVGPNWKGEKPNGLRGFYQDPKNLAPAVAHLEKTKICFVTALQMSRGFMAAVGGTFRTCRAGC